MLKVTAGIGPGLRVCSPSLPLPSHHLHGSLGIATLQVCLHPHPVKGRVSYCGRQKMGVRNTKRNLPPEGISKKGWQPSQALGLACVTNGGSPDSGKKGCLLPACQVEALCSWISWHTLGGTHRAPSSIPDSLTPFCHSPSLSPHHDRGERQGITSPRFCLPPRCSAAALSAQGRASRPFPAGLSPISFQVSVSQCSH